MRLTRVVLEKNGSIAVLQGVVHIGPRSLYKRLQRELDEATKRGHLIFFEGVRVKKKHPPALTENEKNIRRFFVILLEKYQTFGTAFGFGVQKKHIRYPRNAINADVEFAHLTRKLDDNGFNCDSILELFDSVSEYTPARIRREIEKEKRTISLLQVVGLWCYRHIINPFQMRKATPIIVEYRNEFAVAKILACGEWQHALIHYGEGHVPGMVRLFKKAGWRVQQTTHETVHDLDRALRR